MTYKLFSFVAILFLLFSGYYAQDGEVETSDEDNVIADAFSETADDFKSDDSDAEEKIITSSPDVIPSSIFPRYYDARLPIGKLIELLIGFKNTGQKTFNVTSIHGSFRYTADPSIFVQNFTSWRGGSIIKTFEHVTFQYYFYPDELLEPKDYHFVVYALYSDEDNVNYTTTFYNGTIEMIEESTPLDFQTFFTYILILGVLGLIGYVLYTTLGLKKRTSFLGVSSSTFSSSTVETGTVGSSANEYVADSNVSGWKKQKAEADKNKAKKSKK